jgi:hypothetical protein
MGSNSGAGILGGAGAGLLGGGLAGVLGGMLGGALLGGRGGFGNNGNYGGPVAGAVATDIILNPAFNSLQNQIQTLQGQVGANDLRNEMESMENTFAVISSGQTSANAANFANITNQIGEVKTAQAANNFTTLQSINDLGRDVTAQSNQQALQQLNSFNNLTTTTLTGFNTLAMQSNIATQQIIAGQVAQAAAMAQCCCDIKQLIQSDGNVTRALINQLDKENLLAQLADAKNQASNLAQTIAFQNIENAQTSTIIRHLAPREVAGAIV